MSGNIGTVDQLRDKNLDDIKGLPKRRIYFYQITNHKDKGFIKEQTISILHLEPLYSVMASRNEEKESLIQENKANNSKGNTAVLVPRATGMFYSSEQHIKKTGNVLIASFDKSITLTNGVSDQELYFVDDIERQLIEPRTIHGKPGLYNPTDFILTNMNDVKNTYNALMFLLTWEKELVNPVNIDLSFDNHCLLSKIMAKGVVSGKRHQDIDLFVDEGNSSAKFSLLAMTPTSTNYKLSMFSHWLDPNRTLSFQLAKKFTTSKPLKELFTYAGNGHWENWTNQATVDKAYQVIQSMMLLTHAYATNFTDYRSTEAGKEGQIDGSVNIGGMKLVDIADKNPINAIDGFVEKFKSENPTLTGTIGFKIMLQVIVLLSSYINSSYAIAKGNNDFHKVYLPWYFVPQKAINKQTVWSTFPVILHSEYFDINNVNDPLNITQQFDHISLYQAHDLNGWISQPELPNKIQPINKFARPGDISLNSDDALKYLFYVPYAVENDIEKLYGTIQTTQLSGWHDDPHGTYTKTFEYGYTKGTNAKQMTEAEILQYVKDKLIIGKDKRYKEGTLVILKNDKKTITRKETVCYISHTYYDNGAKYCNLQDVTYTSYEAQITFQMENNGNVLSQNIIRKGTIYDKANWRETIEPLNADAGSYRIALTFDNSFDTTVEYLNEINIQAVWLDYISISIANNDDTIEFTNIELPSLDDETLTNMTILM